MFKNFRGAVAVAAAMAVLAVGFSAGAQEKKATTNTPSTTKSDPKAKSACNAITDEKACRADATCVWIKALVDPTTGKQKRKAYCKTKSSGAKKTTTTTPATK